MDMVGSDGQLVWREGCWMLLCWVLEAILSIGEKKKGWRVLDGSYRHLY